MKDNGRMIWQMEKEFINIVGELNMKENGKMIYKMDMVLKHGQGYQIQLSMKVNTKMERKMVKEHCILLIKVNILENFWKMKFQGMVNIYGQTEKFIKEHGKIIK